MKGWNDMATEKPGTGRWILTLDTGRLSYEAEQFLNTGLEHLFGSGEIYWKYINHPAEQKAAIKASEAETKKECEHYES